MYIGSKEKLNQKGAFFMTDTAALRLDRTERTISFTLTLPRPRLRPRQHRREIRRERVYTLGEAAYFTQRPLI